jgi:hypothetical protein
MCAAALSLVAVLFARSGAGEGLLEASFAMPSRGSGR